MKKLALILAIAFIAALAAPAMASDFSAGGQARFEAVNVDDGDSDSDVDDRSYFDQRYRVAFTWKVNDNVTTQLRGDFAETAWGDGYRPDEGKSTIMIDRAWVKINSGILTTTVGQQGGQFGHGMIWSYQFQGIMNNLDFNPVQVRLLYEKAGEGALDDDSDDADIYGAQVNYKSDAFDGGITYVYGEWEEGAGDYDVAGYGAHFTAPLGNFTLKGALAMFDGEDDTFDEDIVGTQLFISADTAINDAFSIGGTFVWADSADSDETQATSVQDDGVFNILDFGGAMQFNNVLSYMPYGNDIFDVEQEHNGVLGGLLRAQWAASDTLTFWAKLGYFEPEDGDDMDSLLYYNANVDWVWMPAVTLSAGIAVQDPDTDLDTDETILTTVQLTVAF